MIKLIEKLTIIRKEDVDKFEATKFTQERIDLYFDENNSNIARIDAEHNATGRHLSGHLITYATIVIGLTSLVVGQENIRSQLNLYQKSFLFVGAIFLFLSILGGALEQWDSMVMYKTLSRLYVRANVEVPLMKMESTKELQEFKNGLFKGIKTTSNSRGLIAQVGLLSIGSVLYLILFATILYKP